MAFARFKGRSVATRQQVTLKFDGEMQRRIDELARRSKSLKVPMKRVAQHMLRSTHRNFVAQGRIDEAEGVWQPLAPSTIRRRRKGQQRGKIRILRDTGRLKKNNKSSSDDFSASVSNNTHYAADHNQQGMWGNVLVKTETFQVDQHTRKQMVTPGYSGGPKKTKSASKRPRVAGVSKKRRKRKRVKKSEALVKKDVVVRPYTMTVTSRIPARPFLRIHDQDIDRALAEIREWLLKQKFKPGRRR